MVNVELANACDLDGWMGLVEQVRDSFPGLETQAALEEHRKTVLEFISRKAAICAKREDQVVGALLFSREPAVLCFLAVDAACRRQHIGERMVSCMRTFLDPAKEVTVTTYREDVPEGAAARAFYKRLGFVEGKLTEEFGSPVQEFIWKP